eukprot:NODE_11579_length_445_cov_13.968944_g10924_i0.p1 GENE.NODE_11579_length_445_cov_13.968944_g10924_i0~~NODE_11579_length_445_cov_13.968944_g10924_i0.p1  ORF type:complete len:146 (-),score=41.90 NODE_11579_length_445_cov_13.968944_g10924_i0:8-385(-)
MRQGTLEIFVQTPKGSDGQPTKRPSVLVGHKGTHRLITPKKAMSALCIFIKEKKAIYLKEHPLAKTKEVNQALTEIWKSLSSEDKQPFEDKANHDRQRYLSQIKDQPKSSESQPAPEQRKKKKKI